MRSDETTRSIVSNGYSANAAYHAPRKGGVSVNGHSPHLNGSAHALKNGTSKRKGFRSPLYRGHNREELTRILIQGLKDMGYEDSANSLSSESGYELESSEVASFRAAILSGRWVQAERILAGHYSDDGGGGAYPEEQGIVLAEHASRDQMLFWIRKQKFLELLVRRDLLSALKVLREELTPLHHDTYQLHTLSGLLMCTQAELETQLRWPEDPEDARQRLLEDLTNSIAPSVMIRDHRLAELLDHVKRAQINGCRYHNTSEPPSLYSDHECSQQAFPSSTDMILEQHSGEVYCVAFSPDGTKLATAGEDKICIIYDTRKFQVIHRLQKHTAPITHISWSPDSKRIVTTAAEPHAHVWDAVSGKLVVSMEHQTGERRPITSAAWTPDSERLVTGCHDRDAKMCLWDLNTQGSKSLLHTWSGEFRVSDLAITSDGRRIGRSRRHCITVGNMLTWLVCNDMDEMLIVYNLDNYREEFRLKLSSKITCITASRDSPIVIVNIAEGEVHMIDVDERCLIRKFKGESQGGNIIRNCFGGAAENFVLSGSKGKQTPTSSHRLWLTCGRRSNLHLAQGELGRDSKAEGAWKRVKERAVRHKCLMESNELRHVCIGR